MQQPALRMLVGDDSAVCRSIFRDAVAAANPSIVLDEANDGSACVRLLAGRRYDLAFLDVHMPGASGLEVLGAIRGRGEDTLTVIMSSRPRSEVVDLARRFRAYDFLAKPFAPDAVTAIVRNHMRVSRPVSVLVVDDSATVRRIVSKVMSQSVFDIRLHEADSGAAAIGKCRSNDYDLIFLDFNMPGMDGAEALAMIRSIRPGARVVVASGEPRERVQRQLGAAAADTLILSKPFFPHDVDAAIHDALGLTPTYSN